MKENNKNNIKNKFVTPVMKQFWEAKESYPNSIMLFRMGDFYETFDEDAKIASKILGITLTKRSNGAASSVALAGFPYHSLDQYLYKLLNSGHRVAICEQVEDPKVAKGIVKREVVEVVSPGTAIADKYLNHNENNFLCSLYFNKDCFSYSFLDYSTGEFSAGENSVSELYNIINHYNVTEIIVCKKQEYMIDHNKINNILITTYHNWIADLEICYEKMINHFATNSLKGFGFSKKDLSIIASGAALSYVEENYFGKIKHITSLSKIAKSDIMKLDSATIKNLELFESLNSKDNKSTLFHTIDNTSTPMGARLLKQHISEPLISKVEINNRLNLIEEYLLDFIDDEKIINELNSIGDIQRTISKISIGKSNPRDLVQLSQSLVSISRIKKYISKNIKLKKSLDKIKNIKKICNYINKNIIDDPPVKINKGGFVKEGVSKELDKLRLISNNANKWLVNYQNKQKELTDIPSLKIGYNKVFGFYIDITKTHIKKVPESYIRKQTLTNSERYFTLELKDYEEKILTSSEKIAEIENAIYDKVIDYILGFIDDVQYNSNLIANFDVIVSHSLTANENNYSKPVIKNKSSKLVLKKSRHPVIEKILPLTEKFITNDVQLGPKKKQIAIITGPNMAGKSTFLRQVGLIAILSQIGSYVPAKIAEIPIIDQLFTRVGASDNLASGESTFLVEMNETANILNNATPNSLIILDEIGRGTSTYDGLSLAWSITEYLHNNLKVKAKTLFATHYHELIDLVNNLPDAYNLNVAVEEYNDEIVFLRKINNGGANKSYGINVAKMAGLPSYIISRANELLFDFMDQNKNINMNDKSANKQIDIFDKNDAIVNEIKSISLNDLTPIDALNKLNDIKKKLD